MVTRRGIRTTSALRAARARLLAKHHRQEEQSGDDGPRGALDQGPNANRKHQPTHHQLPGGHATRRALTRRVESWLAKRSAAPALDMFAVCSYIGPEDFGPMGGVWDCILGRGAAVTSCRFTPPAIEGENRFGSGG